MDAREYRIEDRPLRIPLPESKMKKLLWTMALPPMQAIVRLKTLNGMYARVRMETAGRGEQDTRGFLRAVLEELECGWALGQGDLEKIPESGSLLVVANHPFGAIEGLCLAALLLERRPDVKIMANGLLAHIEELSDLFVLVNPFKTKGSHRDSLSGLRQTMCWLKKGGVLGMFPAGEVSSLDVRSRRVADSCWSDQVARIVRKTGADVLPVYFGGRNGPLFHLAGMVHPGLRTLLLPSEMLRMRRSRIEVRIGSPVPHRRLCSFETDRQMVSYLRARTYNLGCRKKEPKVWSSAGTAIGVLQKNVLEMARQEAEAVDSENVLTETEEFRVFIDRAARIPSLLQEIGRCRETAFRQVGEGTGKATDLDIYDSTYLHLVLWDKVRQTVAGAYRIGESDKLLQRFGTKGLYACSLFSIKPRFFSRIGPALELGRSFIMPEYQRMYAPLLLLWKGIGVFVAKNPHYRTLYGPVSISDSYQTISKRYMLEFLRRFHNGGELERLVRPHHPPRFAKDGWPDIKSCFGEGVRSMEDLSDLVRDVEPGLRDVPVLLRQYLRLGGSVIGFNTDKTFGNALDGLIVVDLTRVEPGLLKRFMGRADAKRYLSERFTA